jgi:hypothetical protein
MTGTDTLFSAAATLVDRARAYSQVGDYAASLSLYNQANSLLPDNAEIVNGLATALRLTGDDAGARRAFLRAESLEPEHPRVMLNFCAIANSEGEHELADCFLHEARRRDPNFVNVRWFDAMRLFRQMRYREAWPLFECRFELQGQRVETRLAGGVPWQGQAGAKLVLLREQGLGDCMQMVRFLPALADRTEVVAVETPPELRRLFQHSFPGLDFMANVERVATDGVEVLPLLSIGHRLNLAAEDIPGGAYLRPLPADVTAWSSALGPRQRYGDAAVPRVAFFWFGNPKHANDRQRSLPVEAVASLVRWFDFEWLIIQKNVSPMERDRFPANCRFIGDDLHDFADTAALLSQVDLLIGVDSAPTHLAGALGVESWLLLPVSSDWRWGIQGESTVWYESLRLFRQNRFRDWQLPLDRLIAALMERFPGWAVRTALRASS